MSYQFNTILAITHCQIDLLKMIQCRQPNKYFQRSKWLGKCEVNLFSNLIVLFFPCDKSTKYNVSFLRTGP